MNLSVDPFVLTPHEVMRGIRVKENVLVLRSIGWVQAACWIEMGLASVATGALIAAGGWWWLLLPVVVFSAVNAGRRARVAVFASKHAVTIRNRWRRVDLSLDQIQEVGVSETHWPVRQPAYLFTGTSVVGRSWEVGIITTDAGARFECDSLVSAPSTDALGVEPTPAAMKAQALSRWIDNYRQPKAAR